METLIEVLKKAFNGYPVTKSTVAIWVDYHGLVCIVDRDCQPGKAFFWNPDTFYFEKNT
jgi:hypothetical protein